MRVPLLVAAALVTASVGVSWCTKPSVRREWRTLSSEEKQAYIEAVKCLQASPSQLSDTYPASGSRFDDFNAVHIDLTERYHFTGPFLPWHRLFVRKYETDLKDLCDYEGAQPYWDWTLDVDSEDSFLAAPVFDPVDGFGGNGPFIDTSDFNETNVPVKIPGKTGGGCVFDGPFVNMTVIFGPGPNLEANPRCLARDFAPSLALEKLTAEMTDWVLEAETFTEFDHRFQGVGIDVDGMTIHAGGHLSVGGDIGDVGNMYSSPSDPLFYLHHANLDRLWDQWQRVDFEARKADMGGPDTMFAFPWDFFGEVPYENITLETELEFKGLVENVKISEVMDIHAANLCIEYE
ncbi:hypothetical protein VUR80DRAFT_2967 [Thermomyces stellatus]